MRRQGKGPVYALVGELHAYRTRQSDGVRAISMNANRVRMEGEEVASQGGHEASPKKIQKSVGGDAMVFNHRARPGAGYKTARVEIGAVRENLAIDLKPGGLTRGFKLRARDREHREVGRNRANRPRDCIRDCAVIRRQVTESPVRLHVAHGGAGDPAQSPSTRRPALRPCARFRLRTSESPCDRSLPGRRSRDAPRPRRRACAAKESVTNIVSGSPAWPPQATLALVATSIIAASSPIDHGPKPSPRSEFRSILRICDIRSCCRPAWCERGGSRRPPDRLCRNR